MKKIAKSFKFLWCPLQKFYKFFHKVKSKNRGIKYVTIINTGLKNELGEVIFETGESGVTYMTEPKVKKAEKQLGDFKNFLKRVQKIPSRNDPFWFERFN
ncbi:MAG: hypothetical protein NTW62_01130 [Candidatus Nomurabacteria bacterium]|nr:hypothetical protein [Candidatus Nomurabacteria bacterium]